MDDYRVELDFGGVLQQLIDLIVRQAVAGVDGAPVQSSRSGRAAGARADKNWLDLKDK